MGVYGFLPGEVHVRVWRLFLQGGSFGIRTLHSRLCTIIVALLSTNKSDHICAYAPVINQSTPILQVGVRSWPRAQGCKKGIVSEGLRLDSSSSSHQRNQNQTCSGSDVYWVIGLFGAGKGFERLEIQAAGVSYGLHAVRFSFKTSVLDTLIKLQASRPWFPMSPHSHPKATPSRSRKASDLRHHNTTATTTTSTR